MPLFGSPKCAVCGNKVEKAPKDVAKRVTSSEQHAVRCRRCGQCFCEHCAAVYYKDHGEPLELGGQVNPDPQEDHARKMAWGLMGHLMQQDAPCPSCGQKAVGWL